ncbi:DUF1365 domain-containing protein [Skermania piniformis]
MTPALVYTRTRHVRHTPIRHEFSYRGYSWLVDLDDLPRVPWWLRPVAGFAARDHVGDPDRTLRENVDAYLAGHGIDLRGGSVRMLTNARVFGYVFNPLTVYWCRDHDDRPVCVIAEVHNTYRGRHRYLLHTDEHGRARIPKQFYVSPFNPVGGEYRIRAPQPTDRICVAITLADPTTVFSATTTGLVRPASTTATLRAAIRHPFAPQLVSLRIRRQGLRLWTRGLPIVPRPRDPVEEPNR